MAGDGYWTSCGTCARVYWQPYGKTSREAHGPYGDCGPLTYDEGRLDGARDEADFLNDLESVAETAGG